MSFFEDVDKKITDLFNEGFNYYKSLNISSLNESGTIVSGQGILGYGTPRFNIKAGQADGVKSTSVFTLNHVSIDNNGRVSGDLSMKTSDVSSLYIRVEDERSEPGRPLNSSGTIGAAYTSERFAFDTNVDIVNGPTSRSSLIFNYLPWNLKVGGEIKVNTHVDSKGRSSAGGAASGMELEDFNIAAVYQGKSHLFTARTKDRMGTIDLGYYHSITPKVATAALVNHTFNDNTQQLSMGAEIELDADNNVKMLINSSSELSGSLRHKLNNWAHLNICAQVNLHQTAEAKQKFGIGITFDGAGLKQ